MSNVPMTLPELMLAEHTTCCGHASTFVELDDGRILHMACHWKNHSEDGGLTWSPLTSDRVVDINGNLVSGYALVKLSGSDIGAAGTLRPPHIPSGSDGNARGGCHVA